MRHNIKNIVSQKEHRINHEIKAKYVFLIDENGEKIGSVNIFEARERAANVSMDLVQISIQDNLSICKIMNYGKFCFENKKNKKNNKNNKNSEIKEIQIRPFIEENDFQVKLKKIKDFIEEGCKINIILKFKGREAMHPENGLKIMNKFIEILNNSIKIESAPKVEGKRMIMVIAPKIKKD